MADLGGGCTGADPPPLEMTCGFLIQLVFAPPPPQKKTSWFIGVEVKYETSLKNLFITFIRPHLIDADRRTVFFASFEIAHTKNDIRGVGALIGNLLHNIT